MAETDNLMDVFANAVEAEGAMIQYEPLSKYYSSRQKDNVMAGKFYYLNGDFKPVSLNEKYLSKSSPSGNGAPSEC